MKLETEQYKKEIKQLILIMSKAEQWAKKIPLFEKEILDNKITGEELYKKYGERYKTINLSWGINRNFYESDTNRYITNYVGKKYKGFFWNVYVNSYSLFGMHENFGLENILNIVNIFSFDKINSNFYITDENIEQFLEALNNWYINAKVEAKKLSDQQKIEQMENDLKKLKGAK